MHTSNLLAFLSGLLASACASPLSHHSGPRADGQGQVCATDNYCAGTNFNESLVPQYICGDPHLGPTQLPTHLPLDTLFSTYNRFSGLCPGAFLIKYFNASAGNGGRWIYPDYDGFELDTVNKTISGTILLKPGTLLDRFGAETGGFLSPAEAPFLQRSLPPDSLDNNGSDPRLVKPLHKSSSFIVRRL